MTNVGRREVQEENDFRPILLLLSRIIGRSKSCLSVLASGEEFLEACH